MIEAEPTKSAHDFKIMRRMSISSHKKAPVLPQNQKANSYSRTNNYTHFLPVFDSGSEALQFLYCQTIKKCVTKAALHVGIVMDWQKTLALLKCFVQHPKILQTLKPVQRSEGYEELLFLPFSQVKVEGCSLIFWFLTKSEKEQKELEEANKFEILINSFPQMIIADKVWKKRIENNYIKLNEKLRFQQQIVLLGEEDNFDMEDEWRRFHYIEQLQKKTLHSLVLSIMKKNSIRCFHEPLKINLYLLDALLSKGSNLVNQKKGKENHQKMLNDILDLAQSNYLSEQVERKYEMLVLSYKTSGPKNEKQIQADINSFEEEILLDVKKNTKIFFHPPSQKQKIIDATEKKIFIYNQQIITTNRQLTKKQNNQLLKQLYDQLLSHFEKGRYLSKNRVTLMADDLTKFLENFEKRAIKSSISFSVFNNFMRQNKSRYYQKLQTLEDRLDENKKNMNFDDLFDKTQMAKKICSTLEKQIKQLEDRRSRIQRQTQIIKKQFDRQFETKNLDTEGDELYEADSIKTIKAKPISSSSPKVKGAKLQSFDISIQQKSNKKQRKCCCNCSIF